MNNHIAFIKDMVDRGGPDQSEYWEFDSWFEVLNHEIQSGKICQKGLTSLRNAFGPAISPDTIQGFSFQKPHGYAGDFEVIDKIYQTYITPITNLQNWDRYFHSQAAPIAVRNRKSYFVDLMKNLEKRQTKEGGLYVLNVASGPARDLLEFYEQNGNGKIHFDCIEYDSNAIDYAIGLCRPYLENLSFYNMNAFRMKMDKKYHLILSAGLFDYLNDKQFKFLLKRLLSFLETDGELVIGNFSKNNPTRHYMEIVGDWYLHHRSFDELISLVSACGVPAENIEIGQEPMGVNLFVHIKNGRG